MTQSVALAELPASAEASAILAEWLREYARRDRSVSFDQWLVEMIEHRAELARELAMREAGEVIDYIGESHTLHDDLRQHRWRGNSRSSWIARQVEQVATWAHAQPSDIAALMAMLTGQAAPPNHATDGDWKLRYPWLERGNWNDVTRIDIGGYIEQCARGRSAGDVLEQGARDVLGDAAQRLLADYPEASRLVQDYLQGRLDPTLRNGLQATLASATALAARRGLMGPELLEFVQGGDALLPGWFAHQTWLGTERMRVLHDLGAGRLDADEAIDLLADQTTAMTTKALKAVCKRVGGEIGATLVSYVPIVGKFLSPVGRKVGGWLGEQVAGFAGSKVGQAVRQGVSAVKNVAEKAYSAAKSFVSSAVSTVSNAVSWVSSLF